MRTREEIMGEANAQNMKYKHLEVLLDIRDYLAERERILKYISSKVELCDTYYDFDVEMVPLQTIRKALYFEITNLDT